MKHLIIIALASTIIGCTVDNSDSCTAEHDYTTQQVASNGLTLEPSTQSHITFEQMQQYYGETQSCMGMTADGPIIKFVSFKTYFNGALGSPWAIYTGGHIFMNTDENLPAGIDRTCDTDRQAIKHEYIHHILDQNGADWHHGNPMFAQCGIGVNTSN